MRRTQANWQWSGPEIPRSKTPITRLRVGLDGRIWVQLATPSEKFDPSTAPQPPVVSLGGGRAGGSAAGNPTPSRRVSWREPQLFDVFEPDGTYVGQVSVGFDVTIHATRGDFVWGVVRDGDGVESVHRFRIGWR
jgi:hypothetical protein